MEMLRRLAAKFELDKFADQILDSYWTQLETGGPRPSRQEAHRWVRWNLDLVIRWFVDGRPPTDEDLDIFRARARAQAQDGIPADLVPGNFRRGARFAWSAILERATEQERQALLETADLLFDYVDQVSRIYAEAYQAAERSAASDQEHLARAAIRRLSCGEPLHIEDVELAAAIGFDVNGIYVPSIFALENPANEHLQLAARLRSHRVLAASEGRWVVALANRPIPQEIEMQSPAIIARGDPTARDELGRVLAEQRLLIEIAGSQNHSGVVDRSRYLPELLLRTTPRIATDIRQQIYGPLRSHPELIRTLDMLIEQNFNRSRTAAALPVHRNTLRDRLDRIAQLTGINIEATNDRGWAWLAHLYASQSPAQTTTSATENGLGAYEQTGP